MRFRAPPRAAVAPGRFDHPVFAGFQPWRGLLEGPAWPDCAALQRAAAALGQDLRFVEQTPGLLADGLHYEQRIALGRGIATRRDNWHDLLNALVWLRWPQLKQAMNLRQVQDIARVGPRRRTRGQCALTHFDEAGVLVVLRSSAPLADWDAHDWERLFGRGDGAGWALAVVGHALLEHALLADRLLVGKALVVIDPALDLVTAARRAASLIAAGRWLRDPQELRPLPLMGLRGWHPRAGEAAFCREAPCFRPLRAGRRYPPPLALASSA